METPPCADGRGRLRLEDEGDMVGEAGDGSVIVLDSDGAWKVIGGVAFAL